MPSKEAKILALILLVALCLRLSPVMQFNQPISYDGLYHIRMASSIQETGFLPETDPALGGREYTYPPFYHLLLSSLSFASGFSVKAIAMYLLPLTASLLAIAFYLIARKMTPQTYALAGALLVAVAPPLVSASFDSPEVFVFLLLPFILLLLHKEKNKSAGFFFAACFYWNYLAFAFMALPLLLAFHKNKRFIASALSFLALFGAGWLWLYGFQWLLGGTAISGTDFVANNLRSVMPGMILYFAVIVLPALAFSFRNLSSDFLRYWFYQAFIAFSAMLSYFLTFAFRSWEQPKIFALSVIGLLVAVKRSKALDAFLALVLLVSVYTSLVLSFQVLYPKVTSQDIQAIEWLEGQKPEGSVLAEPTFSEAIMAYSSLDEKVLTALYLETDTDLAGKSLEYLGQGVEDENAFLEESELEYIIVNFEDTLVRGTEKFDGKPYLNKVYSMGYYSHCPFYGLVYDGFLCQGVETEVFQKIS